MPREYLPVFNSNVIDLYIPRIEGLSERYLYACDDYIVMREQKPEDYFSKKAAHSDIFCKFAVRGAYHRFCRIKIYLFFIFM